MKTVNLNIEVKMNGITVANIPMSIDVKMDNENETQNHNAITVTSERTFRRYIMNSIIKNDVINEKL